MRIVSNNLIPARGFSAINLFGVLFVRRDIVISDTLIRHEKIHSRQMQELGYIFFYLIYIFEWILRLLQSGNAYRNISFEREAYLNQADVEYLKNRRPFAQWRH